MVSQNLCVMLYQVVLSGVHQLWQAAERRHSGVPAAALPLKHGEAHSGEAQKTV